MELFVYVRMGGTPEDSVIKVLDDKGLLTLEESLANFDAAKAGCYLSSDRQRLLGVIEAGAGEVKKLNDKVKADAGKLKDTAKEQVLKGFKAAVEKGSAVILESVDVAKEALQKASLLERATNKAYIAGLKLGDKGYDSKGRPLAGRELNLRKRDTVAARKPGDMANSDDTALIARAQAVMRGEPVPK